MQLKVNVKRNKILFYFLIATFIYFLYFNVWGQQAQQKIDLGAISVEGEIITPSDLSIDSDMEESTLKLYKRTNYKDKMNINLQSIF